MSDLILYTNPQSRGRIVHWMMEELGLPYETVWLDYATTMKAPEFRAINPMGKVPALRHGEVVVTETSAICAYLADRFPEQGLAPPDNDLARANYYRWLFFAAGPVEQAVTAHSMGWEVPEGKEVSVGFGTFEQTRDVLPLALEPGPYICGEQFTAADVYIGANIGWGILFGTIEMQPIYEEYLGNLHARPAYQRAEKINDDYMKSQAAR